MTDTFLTVREVAEKIRMTEDYVTRVCNSQDLKGVKLGNVWRISPEALDAFMTPRPVAKTATPDAEQRPSGKVARETKKRAGRTTQRVAS
ncbi:MAG: helix-turn-helix domain-containing protein [Aeromicrobium sp.]